MTGRKLSAAAAAVWLFGIPACGAGSAAPKTEHPAAATERSGLVGRWARYWSTSGRVDTECYVFDADGRFHWRQADEASDGVTRRSGTWARHDDELALSVQEPRIVTGEATPVEQRLALGPCPDNPEARAMDPHYACVSIDGKAFFRQNR